MNISEKRATYTSLIFGVLFVFLVTYFAVVGPSRFLDNKVHFVINSIVLFAALVSFLILMVTTNKSENIVDERDLLIQKKAFGVSIVVILLYVFLICIVLFIIYRSAETVIVSWMWFIAYSTFAFAYFTTSLTVLYYYNKE